MNLLKVQDALKNASDQQLMALMQAPDSTAPSYLVLSEIRRRKDMRSKQAPEGQSNRTVAEELTAPEAPAGIRGLQSQMDPDGVDAAEGGDVQGMAAGGIVRMQAGGNIMGDIPFPTYNYEDMTIPPSFQPPAYQSGQSLPMVRSFQPRGGDVRLRGAQREAQAAIRANPLVRNDAGLFDRIAGQYGVSADDLRQSVLGPLPSAVQAPGDVAPLGSDAPMRPQVSALAEDEPRRRPEYLAPPPDADRDAAMGRIPPAGQPNTRTGTQGQGQAGRPTTPQATAPQGAPGGGAPGIEGLRNAPTGIPEGGQLPTMADLMRQNAALFPDGLGGIRDRMREERVDPAARRSEAVNMALIEAGLRIAGSRNPSLIGAIGEGALPAVQSYSQQLGQIRGEQRQARQDELELAKQDTNRQFAIGQISAAEYRSRMDNINRNIQVNAQERGANARLAASEAAAERRATAAATAAEQADLRRGLVTPEQYARMTPEQRENLRELRGMGRPADVAGSAQILRTVTTDLRDLRTRLSELNSSEPSATTGFFNAPNPARARWLQEKAAIEAQIADQERLRRFHEGVLQTGRAGAQASSTTARPNATNPSDPFGLR
jgi:hypothetical protein